MNLKQLPRNNRIVQFHRNDIEMLRRRVDNMRTSSFVDSHLNFSAFPLLVPVEIRLFISISILVPKINNPLQHYVMLTFFHGTLTFHLVRVKWIKLLLLTAPGHERNQWKESIVIKMDTKNGRDRSHTANCSAGSRKKRKCLHHPQIDQRYDSNKESTAVTS